MSAVEPTPAEQEEERARRSLETRIESLLALGWKTHEDVARAASMTRKAAALAAAEDASPRARALGGVARAHLALLEGNLDTVVRLGESILDRLDGPEDTVWQCHLLGDLAVAKSMQGRLADAKPLYERGLHLARTLALKREEFRFLYNLAELHMTLGLTDRALTFLQEARALATRMGDRRFQGMALEGEGNLYRVLGAYPEATSCLLAAIEHLDSLHQQAPSAIAYYDLATVYSLTGMHEQAIAAANEAVDRLQGSSESLYLSNALAALGFAHLRAGRLDDALDATERSLAMRERLGLTVDAAGSLLMLGDIHREAGRLPEAEARYREGLERAADLDEPRVSLGCRAGLAAVLEARGQSDEALRLAQPLVAAWAEIGEKESLVEAHDLVAMLHEATGDSVAALASLKRARTLRAELLNRESNARLQHLQITHEVAREREKAAEALRTLSRRVMESQEQERKRVARDLHDDLSQRLALLAVELDVLGQTPPESMEVVRERFSSLAEGVRRVAERVRRISHRLHPATLEQVGFVAATKGFCSETANAYGVEIVFIADEVSGELSDEIELGLFRMVQEALRNAIRHGRAKTISVRLFENPAGICLQVRDTGSGFDPEALEGVGIGLVGMRERAEHLGGRLDVRSSPGRGTSVEVSIPTPGGDA